jgi:hypothetical protein
MPTTMVRATRNEPLSLPRWVRWLAGAIAIGYAVLALSAVVSGPRFVSQVTFVNASPYALNVQVAGANRDGWMLLGTVAPKTGSTVAQVVDQGDDTWVFRVQAQGIDVGDIALSRSDLVASGWRVTIPPALIARLEAQQVPAATTAG